MNPVNIEIAGVNFLLSFHDLILQQNPDPAYRSFFGQKNRQPEALNIKIELELGDIPETRRYKKIFDSGEAWSLHKNGDIRYLLYKPPEYEQPPWLLRFDQNFSKIKIFCGETLIKIRNERTEILNPFHYPMDQLLLMYILAQNKGVIIHAAGISIEGKGLLFAGESGAGKSTIANQLHLKKDTEIISDDRVVVRIMQGDCKAFGTPWPGEGGFALNKSMPLSGIFFLEHGSCNRMVKIKPQKALEKFLPLTSIPWYDSSVMAQNLLFIEELVTKIPAFELFFKPDEEIFTHLRDFVGNE